MVTIFFIYGLAFFSLGLIVAMYPRNGSAFRLAQNLRYFASFGILHGMNEWVDMFILMQKPEEFLSLQVVRTFLLAASFICLVQFGTKSVSEAKNSHPALKVVPAVLLLAAWAVIVMESSQRFLAADIWGRYLLGVPGIFLTFYALILQIPELKKTGLLKSIGFLRISAAAFFLYGILAGIIVPEAGFFPASVLNYALFAEHVGIPVQAFRTICAVAIAYSTFKVLGIFDWETKEALRNARDELEQRVRERTRELRLSNMELEKFAAVASHDLQSPLISVSSILKLLRRHSGGRLDKESEQDMANAEDIIGNMLAVIRNLLDYSRLGTGARTFGTAGCEAALNQALANLKAEISESGAKVTSNPLPEVTGDTILLSRLFQNFINNAIKFHMNGPPEIHISAERRKGEWLFSVHDNGSGIEGEDIESIFEIYYSSSRGVSSGTGIGLSTCKKIVELHGGRIWVESEEDKGSTFFFTVPDRGNNHP